VGAICAAVRGELHAGQQGDGTLTLVNQSAGVVNGNDSTSALTVNATIVNSGVLEGTTAPGLAIVGNVSNSKLIEALGTSAAVVISGGTVSNTSAGTILASGLGAHVDLLDGTIVSSGTLKTIGFNAVIDTASGGTATLAGGTVASGSIVDVVDGSTLVLTVINGATSGSVVLIGAYTSGNFTLGNDGNGHVLITDPPVVAQKPGKAAARIADGTVLEVDVADSGKVTFGGTNGTLLLDDASLFTGAVAGFRGLDRIDLAQIGFGAETTLGYSANAAGTGATLRVSDGVHTASIALLGNYMAASFATAADGHGGTLITEAEHSTHGPSLTSPRHA
jgi:hypothetical protein